ncbi:MAG: glycosyltransferase family 9 protein [Acidobacteriia bacterium]|nr:glycosyltransferase family 9 protein [Terriglobia bacterium]
MSNAATSPSSGPRILVVRLGAMGDVIHALPAVASLKHSFPGSHLTWLIEAPWATLLEQNPYVDRIAIFERGNPGAWMRNWSKLRAERFDFAVDFQGLVKSALAASMAWPDRIFGFHQSHVRERAAALFYSNKTKPQSAHQVDRNLELAAAAGAASILRTFPLPPGEPEGELPAGGFVLASPMAGWRAKQWPLAFYSRLATRLERELELPLVLNGPADMGELANVPSALVHHSSVAGLIHATRRATAVVGVDSGPLHLAAALAKIGVGIFGPTNPAMNGPYGNTLSVLRSERAVTSYKRRSVIDAGMREIDPDRVFEALKAQLIRHSASCATQPIS